MSEAQTNEHDVAIAEAAVEATEAQAEAAVAIAETQAEAAVAVAEARAEGDAEWRLALNSLQTSQEAERHRLDSELSALREEHRAMAETLLLIQSQQAPNPEPNPENPAPGPAEKVETAEAEAEAEEAKEPEPPARPKAHRWI